MKIYIAGPFFNEKELQCIEQVEQIVTEKGHTFFSPRTLDFTHLGIGTNPWSQAIFNEDIKEINNCDMMVVLYHGNYSDSGTAFEIGYAYAKGVQVVLVHVDRDSNSNLMCHEGCTTNVYLDELSSIDFENIEQKPFTGNMF